MKKILLIGCGYWGKNWYNTIKNSGYELVGVVDPNPIISIDIPLFDKIENINIEFTHAVIATPVQLHFDSFTFLVDKGIKPENILVEKPFGLNSEHASLMQDAYPGFIFLHDPYYQWIKSNISQLGDVLSFNSIRASMGPRIRQDVSIVEDYLIHDLYIFGDLFGFNDIHVNTSLKRHQFNAPIQASDVNIFFTKHADTNIEAKMFSSWWWPKKERQIIIIGTKGSFIWEGDNLNSTAEYYDKTPGVRDKFGNIDNTLIQKYPWLLPSIYVKKSNLELELEAFMENKKPFSDNLMMDVWKFMETI